MMNKLIAPLAASCVILLGAYLTFNFSNRRKSKQPEQRQIHTEDGCIYSGVWKDGRFLGDGTLMNGNMEVIEGQWISCKDSLLIQNADNYTKEPSSPIKRNDSNREFTHLNKESNGIQRILVDKEVIKTTVYSRVRSCFQERARYEEVNVCCIHTLLVDNVHQYFVSNHYAMKIQARE